MTRQAAEITTNDGVLDDRFGVILDLEGDTLVGAVPGRTESGAEYAGAVYIFGRSNGQWAQTQKLTAPTPTFNAVFGSDIDLDADTLAVAAQAGEEAFVYRYNGATWGLEDAIPRNADSGLYAGHIALDGNTLVVTAPGADVNGIIGAGAANVYVRSGTTWSLQQRLVPSDPVIYRAFGSGVALAGDTLLVGKANGYEAGCVYVFTRSGSTWSERTTFSAPDATTAADRFGEEVLLSNGTAFVLASYDQADGGAVYVFTGSGATWNHVQTIRSPDGVTPYGTFGRALAVDANVLVIGDFGLDLMGAAYVYTNAGATWAFDRTLLPDVRVLEQSFGAGAAVSGSTLIIGASGWPAADEDIGAAYVFETGPNGTLLNGERCQKDGDCQSTHCVEQVCCDASCSGACTSCLSAFNGSAQDGTCGFVTAGIDPHHECVDTGAATCGTDGQCDGAGACRQYPQEGLCDAPLSLRERETWTPDANEHQFGISLSIDGAVAAVGGAMSVGSNDSVGVYVYERANDIWNRTKIPPLNETFGFEVAISEGDLLVSGELAWMYEKRSNRWVENRYLSPDNQRTESVALYGDHAFIGSERTHSYVRQSGVWTHDRAFTYVADNYSGDLTPLDVFGTTALVGLPDATGTAGLTYSGIVHVLTYDGARWSEQTTLEPSDPASLQGFGATVAVHGDVAMVGNRDTCQPGTCVNGTPRQGRVYVFHRDGTSWVPQTPLTGSASIVGDWYGLAVDVFGDYALVGAPEDDELGNDAGAAYLYRRENGVWVEVQRIVASNGIAEDEFGVSVALGKDVALIGAHGYNGVGAVYVYDLVQKVDCSSQADCDPGMFCVDGVCCTSACDMPCMTCRAAAKASGADGECGPVATGADPGGDCDDQGASSCGNDGSCDGSGACRKYAAGTGCGTATCSGTQATGDLCDGAGTCSSSSVDCSPYACSSTGCLTACAGPGDCAEGNTCVSARCVGEGGVPLLDAGGADGSTGGDASSGADANTGTDAGNPDSGDRTGPRSDGDSQTRSLYSCQVSMKRENGTPGVPHAWMIIPLMVAAMRRRRVRAA